MKKKLLTLLLVLFTMLCSLSSADQKAKVNLDYASLVSNPVVIGFTKDAVSAITDADSNTGDYLQYDKLSPLTATLPDNSTVIGIELETFVVGSDFKAKPKNGQRCYVSWKIFSNKTVDIKLKPDGPLQSTTSSSVINWQVSLGSGEKAGSTTVALHDYSNDFVPIFTSDISKPGCSGSREFFVESENLLGKPFESYVGSMTAFISIR